MASMTGQTSQPQDELVRTTIAHLKQLTVDRLKRVLKGEGLIVSGVKNELQRRLIGHVYDCDRTSDLDSLHRIQNAVRGYGPESSATYGMMQPSNPYPSPYSNHTPASSASPSNFYQSPTNRMHLNNSFSNMPSYGAFLSTNLTYKPSPFYTIERQLGASIEMRPRETTRDTARATIEVDPDLAHRLSVNSLCRVYVFCAVASYDAAWNVKPCDIAFPGHSEIKINGEEVRANLKGLKNKPGSTRPVDITAFLKKKGAPRNNLELIYALTKDEAPQKYILSVQVVEKKTIDMLVAELQRGKTLTKQRVLLEMQSRMDDDDVVTTSSNMSLKDPVQMTRIETPCRSTACKHNECFDAAVFLALQEQAPTWTCPICNKPAQWDHLVYDQFFRDILLNTSPDVEQVTIEPNGEWHLIKESSPEPAKPKAPGKQSSGDSDDDLIEITEIEPPSATFRAPLPTQTPTFDSSFAVPPTQPSASPAASQSLSKKRPREDTIIDLTLSDDDDEPPLRRVKRPSLASQPSDLSRPSLITPVPYRFNLPPPVPSRGATTSPANGYRIEDYDYDRFMTERL